MARSTDLKKWQWSSKNPVLPYNEDDYKLLETFTPSLKKYIAEAENINASDLDMCEFDGVLEMVYSWGNQRGTEFLARAQADMTEKDFCEYFFK